MKYLIILLFAGLTFSQVTEEEHQMVKNTLVNMTIRWDQVAIRNEALTQNLQLTNDFIADLQAIENPSEELIAIFEKYNINQPERKEDERNN